MVRWLSLWSCPLLCCVVIANEPIDVIIVAGQSNAVGFDAAPSELPPDPIDARVLLWWRCGDPPPDEHDSTSDGWTNLRPQPRGNPITPRGGRQYGNFGQSSGGFGPEVGLARTIVPAHNTSLAIIKVAFSGTHVAGDWNPLAIGGDASATEHDSRGACYRSLVAETHRALNVLAENHRPRLIAVVWVQGESDANAEHAEHYEQNIAAMISSLRQEFEAPELIALLGVNTRFGNGENRFMPQVIAAQKSYAASDPRARYVDTEGASVANRVHFDALGTLEVGKRFANELTSVMSRP